MRLFNLIAVTHLVNAGDKYSASANERDCLQNCKRSTNCQGQEISKGNVPECIQNCRDQCTKDRKEKISEVMARSSHHIRKVAQRKSENKAARAEHRQAVKDAQPPPMIKAFHELREKAKNDGTKGLANDFLLCLKEQKTALGCDGSGPGEAWDCKREMVGNCLDINSNYEGMGSKALVELAHKFRKSEEVAAQTQARLEMQNDAVEIVTEAPSAMENAPKNKHGKVKVSLFKKELSKDKKGKIDTSDIGLDLVQNLEFVGEPAEPVEPAESDEPVYEDEEEGEPVYDIEEEGEEEFDWFADEDAQDESSMLSDFVEVEEEFEEEAEEEGEDERKEKKEPKKKVPLFKLQAKNSKNQDKPQKVKQVSTKPMHGLAKLNHGKDDTVPDIANDVIGDDVIIMEEVEEIEKELTTFEEAALEVEILSEAVLAPEILDQEIKPVITTDNSSSAGSDALKERGIPQRVLTGPLIATNAGYIQLNDITERMIYFRVVW